MEKNSEVLDRITSLFYQTLERHKDLQIVSFAEEKEVKKLGFIGMRVVPAECARIGHAREQVNSIPEDHRYMAKFRNEGDPGFVKVMTWLRRWISEIENDLKGE